MKNTSPHLKKVRQKTWPYGTRKTVRVLAQEIIDGNEMLILEEQTPTHKEAFVLLQKPGEQYGVTQPGSIIFTEGGPTGGYWVFQVDAANSEDPNCDIASTE